MKDRKVQINICLDEIEASIELLNKNSSNQKELKSWIRKQKEILKQCNYKGKIPRVVNKKKSNI